MERKTRIITRTIIRKIKKRAVYTWTALLHYVSIREKNVQSKVRNKRQEQGKRTNTD